MKLIIAGSRDLELCYFELKPIITNYFPNILPPSEIVSGTAKGVDSSGEFYASWNHIPVKQFPADWKKHGKAAGPIRNKQMAEYADAAIVCVNNQSKGSLNMIKCMKKLNKPVYVVEFKDGKYQKHWSSVSILDYSK